MTSVFVKVSETYDLSTKVGKMGLIGIHTPFSDLITRHYSGLIQNFKYARFVSCDVAMACASMLPADPLQIGVEAGSIAPQDMFNPILYRAVSNESMNNILGFIEGKGRINATMSEGSVVDINDADFKSNNESVDQFMMYYGLLSNTNGWKKAMPQAGLSMKGLYPMVYQLLAQTAQTPTGGINLNIGDPSLGNGGVSEPSNDTNVIVNNGVAVMRGYGMRMPRFPTVSFCNVNNKDVNFTPSVNASSNLTNNSFDAYVAMIILPPAKLNQLFYRLKVTWTIAFEGLRSITDISRWNSLAVIGESSYGTDYAAQSSGMSSINGMVDAADADVTKVMDGSS